VEFQIGDKVVYPSQGVSVVEDITDEVFGGEAMCCYNLRLLSSKSKVMVPVANSERIGLRPLSSSGDVKQILKRLSAEATRFEEDWKDRYRANLERIKTGLLDEVVDVLLCLARVSSRKTLSFRERKMFDHARQLLVWEVAQVDGREVEDVDREVEAIIDRRIAEASN